MQLVPFVEHGGLCVFAHAYAAHLMNIQPGRLLAVFLGRRTGGKEKGSCENNETMDRGRSIHRADCNANWRFALLALRRGLLG